MDHLNGRLSGSGMGGALPRHWGDAKFESLCFRLLESSLYYLISLPASTGIKRTTILLHKQISVPSAYTPILDTTKIPASLVLSLKQTQDSGNCERPNVQDECARYGQPNEYISSSTWVHQHRTTPIIGRNATYASLCLPVYPLLQSAAFPVDLIRNVPRPHRR
jgi:hypothetical protein